MNFISKEVQNFSHFEIISPFFPASSKGHITSQESATLANSLWMKICSLSFSILNLCSYPRREKRKKERKKKFLPNQFKMVNEANCVTGAEETNIFDIYLKCKVNPDDCGFQGVLRTSRRDFKATCIRTFSSTNFNWQNCS